MSYISLEEFKKYTNVYGEDNIQQSYIDSAENIINIYLGYSPTLHNYVNYFDGKGTHEVQLKSKPIQTIINVEINDESIPLSDFYNAAIGGEFLYYKNIFPEGKRNIKVEYDAGWGITPNDDVINSEYLPSIIKMTVLRISSMLQAESDGNISITSKSFAESGTRTFVNYTSYDKYLLPISLYKLLVI